MLRINETLAIPLTEIEITQIRAAGPGGQNVNKVANSIHLRFPIAPSSLPESCKKRLLASGDRRITTDGVLVIKAQSYRSTEKNREDALHRLRLLVLAALKPPKKRVPTAPSKEARKRRVEQKQRRGSIKSMRRKMTTEE